MRIVLYIILSLSFFSCSDAVVNIKKTIPDSTWKYDQDLEYSFNAPDSSLHYDIVLKTEHSTDFGYENYYTMVKTLFPDGRQTEQQLSLDLMDKFGVWLGDCNSKECSLDTYLLQNFRFPQKGTYKIILEQYGREESLNGINAITLQLLPHKQ